jgi:uncharacterized membrane protein
MGLDIRTPIGVMFSLLGAVLAVYGVVGDKAIYAKSLGININLWWGIVMLAFGIIMLVMAKRSNQKN